MLRDPMARVISEHQYALTRPSKNKGSLQFLQPATSEKRGSGADEGSFRALMKALGRNMTLDEYIHFPFRQGDFGTINNRQASLLAGSEHAHERSKFQLHYAHCSTERLNYQTTPVVVPRCLHVGGTPTPARNTF